MLAKEQGALVSSTPACGCGKGALLENTISGDVAVGGGGSTWTVVRQCPLFPSTLPYPPTLPTHLPTAREGRGRCVFCCTARSKRVITYVCSVKGRREGRREGKREGRKEESMNTAEEILFSFLLW